MLQGKVAVVTGAGQGLGRAYAEALAAAGASVVVNDLDLDRAQEAVDAITGSGGTAVPVAAAVGDLATAEHLVDRAVGEFGRLDVMVTNAGILRDATVGKAGEEDFDLVVRTHLRGTFTCAKAAFARFREQGEGGRLIAVGSPAGQRASFGQTNYSAAKAGIVGMARTLAAEGKKPGILVNAVVPVALTRMTASIPGLGPVVEAVERGEPVPEHLRASGLGTPADAAGLVVFLASDAAAGVTGQVFGVGGDRVSVWSHPTEVQVVTRAGGWSAESLAEAFPASLQPHLQDYLQPQPGGAA